MNKFLLFFLPYLLFPIISHAETVREALFIMNEVGGEGKGLEIIRSLAEQGNPKAQVTLGGFYETGRVVDQDFLEAAKWYDKAYKQGYQVASTKVLKEFAFQKGTMLARPNYKAYCIDYLISDNKHLINELHSQNSDSKSAISGIFNVSIQIDDIGLITEVDVTSKSGEHSSFSADLKELIWTFDVNHECMFNNKLVKELTFENNTTIKGRHSYHKASNKNTPNSLAAQERRESYRKNNTCIFKLTSKYRMPIHAFLRKYAEDDPILNDVFDISISTNHVGSIETASVNSRSGNNMDLSEELEYLFETFELKDKCFYNGHFKTSIGYHDGPYDEDRHIEQAKSPKKITAHKRSEAYTRLTPQQKERLRQLHEKSKERQKQGIKTVVKRMLEDVENIKVRAKQGDAKAQIQLADMYKRGQRVVKDGRQAFYWYKRAAEQGDGMGQLRLANVYHSGELGIKRDHFEALYWSRQAQQSDDEHIKKTATERVLKYEQNISHHLRHGGSP